MKRLAGRARPGFEAQFFNLSQAVRSSTAPPRSTQGLLSTAAANRHGNILYWAILALLLLSSEKAAVKGVLLLVVGFFSFLSPQLQLLEQLQMNGVL